MYKRQTLSYVSQLDPWLGYGLVFLMAFLESMVFIGVAVPGATLVILAGFLSSQGYLDISGLILIATLGAVLGDSLSYYFGTKGTGFFHNENKWLRAEHLDQGRAFFDKYGSVSIFWARFVAPLRAIVPFVAGISGMDKNKFLFWNVFSAFIWATFHLLIGYFFGNHLAVVETWLSNIWYASGAIIIILGLVYLIRFINRRFGNGNNS